MREAVSYIILKKKQKQDYPLWWVEMGPLNRCYVGDFPFSQQPFYCETPKIWTSVPLTCYLENTHFLLSFFTSTYPSVFGCAGKDKVISVTFNIIGKNNKNIVKQLQVRLKWVH